jgi:hypothetical protein
VTENFAEDYGLQIYDLDIKVGLEAEARVEIRCGEAPKMISVCGMRGAACGEDRVQRTPPNGKYFSLASARIRYLS